jgi:hypothetical protein
LLGKVDDIELREFSSKEVLRLRLRVARRRGAKYLYLSLITLQVP